MVRPIGPHDVPALVPMMRQFLGHTQMADVLGFDEASACHFLALADNAGPVVGFVADAPDSGLAGFILATITPWPWRQDRLVCQEMGWWVEPGYRGGSLALRLLGSLEALARSRGVATMLMISEHGLKHEQVGRLYERRSFTPLEHTYFKELR